MEIRNECSALPKAALWHIRRALTWIYPPDLQGVVFVRLVDKLPIDVTLHLKKCKLPDRDYKSCLGIYMPKYRNRPAHIVPVVGNILSHTPKWWLWTAAPTFAFAHVLAHEVGHHLIATRGYTLHSAEKPLKGHGQYEEEIVNRYAYEVTRKLKAGWYYKLGALLPICVAEVYYARGVVCWERKDFKRAGELLLKAYHLNPELEEALVAHKHANLKMPAPIKGHRKAAGQDGARGGAEAV
jgi:hypothetical protein